MKLLLPLIALLFLGCNERKTENIQKQKVKELFKKFGISPTKDIMNDNVRRFHRGLPFPPFNDNDVKKINSIDSSRKTFGLKSENLGCEFSEESTLAITEYKKITEPYLKIRNGVGWEIRMKKQIDSIEAKYR